MATARRWVIGCAALSLALTGCKSTEVMMVNDLGEDTMVSLQGPGEVHPNPPVLPVAKMGKGVFKLQTPNSKLPANYEWQAGGRIGTIVVTDESPSRQIHNLSTGTPASQAKVRVRGGGRPAKDVNVEVDVGR